MSSPFFYVHFTRYYPASSLFCARVVRFVFLFLPFRGIESRLSSSISSKLYLDIFLSCARDFYERVPRTCIAPLRYTGVPLSRDTASPSKSPHLEVSRSRFFLSPVKCSQMSLRVPCTCRSNSRGYFPASRPIVPHRALWRYSHHRIRF